MSRYVLGLLLFFVLAGCGQPASPTPAPDPERAARHTAYFNEADTNADGVIGEAEIDAVTAADFDTMDVSGDGVVTLEDVFNAEQGEPEGAARNTDLASHLPYDANSDSSITQEEYETYLNTEFMAKMDGNGNGQISLDEYRTYEGF